MLQVDECLKEQGPGRHEFFRRGVDALMGHSPAGSNEGALLESLSNHLQVKGATPAHRQMTLAFGEESQANLLEGGHP